MLARNIIFKQLLHATHPLFGWDAYTSPTVVCNHGSAYLPNSLNPSCSLSLCRPEPHILLFRRPLGTDPQSGRVDPELARQARDEYKNQMGLRK